MDTAEEKVISEESVAGGIFREILYLLLKIVAIATAIVVIFTFIFGVFRYADNAGKLTPEMISILSLIHISEPTRR